MPRWTAVTDDHREWGFNWSPPLIRCEIVTAYYPYTLPDGGEDVTHFSLSSEERATSGTVSLAFKTVSDFEAPGDRDADNQYRLRVVNTHNIHYLNNEGTPTGCSGSVLDLTIRVKDVGVPAPPGDIDAQFHEADDTIVDLEWASPGGEFHPVNYCGTRRSRPFGSGTICRTALSTRTTLTWPISGSGRLPHVGSQKERRVWPETRRFPFPSLFIGEGPGGAKVLRVVQRRRDRGAGACEDSR